MNEKPFRHKINLLFSFASLVFLLVARFRLRPFILNKFISLRVLIVKNRLFSFQPIVIFGGIMQIWVGRMKAKTSRRGSNKAETEKN